MSVKDPNSRKITIFRTNSFLDEAQKGSAPEFVSMSKRSLGSYWESPTSKAVGSGLNFTEQRLLMPLIIDCEVTDRQFRAKVTDYFAEIKTTVPYDKGVELEVGLLDNSKELGAPLSDNPNDLNMPINVAEYIKYRHALTHPEVALSEAEAKGNQLKQYYIYDAQASIEDNKKVSDVKDKALELYLKVKKDIKKVDMLLTLLGIDPRIFSGTNAGTLKIEALKEKATGPDAAKFVSLYEDDFFEDLYVIQSMVNTNVLKKVGEKIIDPNMGTTIGHDIKEAIAWFKDEKTNSEQIVILKAKMQEGLKATIAPPIKRQGIKK